MLSRTFPSNSERRQGRNPTSPEGRRSNAPQRPLTSELSTGLSSLSPATSASPVRRMRPAGGPAPCWVGLNASAGVEPARGRLADSGPEEGGVRLRDALSRRRPVCRRPGLSAEGLEVGALKSVLVSCRASFPGGTEGGGGAAQGRGVPGCAGRWFGAGAGGLGGCKANVLMDVSPPSTGSLMPPRQPGSPRVPDP